VRAATPAVPGVCTAFFQYQDASEEESGIELRSAEAGAAHTVYYTTQPLAPVDVTLPGTDFTCVGFAASAGERAADGRRRAFNEHRFDWLPAATTFFVNGAQTAQIARDVPPCWHPHRARPCPVSDDEPPPGGRSAAKWDWRGLLPPPAPRPRPRPLSERDDAHVVTVRACASPRRGRARARRSTAALAVSGRRTHEW
jgi:hypothetical protein